MDLAAILLLIALLSGVGLYLAAPLITHRNAPTQTQSPEFSTLMAERDRIISALAELDFDYKLGKIPQGEYPLQRGELLKKGAAILKELDGLAPQKFVRKNSPTPETRLEDAAAARSGSSSLSDEQIETMLAARRKIHRSQPAGFCPNCGKPILSTDQFCPHCGKALSS